MSEPVLGIDHVYLSVRDLAASERFYDRALVGPLEHVKIAAPLAGEPHLHYVNRSFGFTLRPARPGTPAHEPYAPGLHHFCFRVADEGAVDRVARRAARGADRCLAAALLPRVRARLLRDLLQRSRRHPPGGDQLQGRAARAGRALGALGRRPGGEVSELPNGWLALARSPAVVRRALGYAVVVGAILISINHGDAILRGDVDRGRLTKMALTLLVPYCVSTLSSVGALRDRAKRAEA